ncbi:hypothetical protein ADJ76_07990 [Schaalia meyeri]|uniref:Glycine zipper family protein n=1 Tax=Schaalia meyeri TaxID=52773 RepID=A0AAQ0BW63_9ACTO|nr:glycine zipper family protein [Schaalia meyeri]AKU65680.1 hypothetical protein ADJ76_07990 [Schaalia meyeri]OFQ22205.1 hypothetical protein HMPREF2946_04610 [Actinomyces sp. HMSC062G12]QQC43601.1 glycine zipper family protein [Schaalia meyeri]
MSEMAGNGNTPEITTSAIDTRIYGNPDDIRDGAAEVYKLYEALNDAHVEMTSSLVPQPEYWAGESADAYEEMLVDFRNRVGENAEFAYRVWEAMRAYAQQLDYHYRDMETIRNNAERCGLEIANDYDIMAPTPAGAPPTMPPADAPMRDQDIYRADLQEHREQVQRAIDFEELRKQALGVRADLEDWVRKHLLSVQSKPPKSFLKYFDEERNEYMSRPWQLGVIGTDIGYATRAAYREDALARSASDVTKLMRLPGLSQIRPVMDFKLKKAVENGHRYDAARSTSSKVSTGATVVSGAVLAYDIATSDEPGKTAVAGGAGMFLGAATGSLASNFITQRLGSAALGAVIGGPLGLAAGFVATAATSAAYDQIPLEYRERVDNALWHWPYYIGMGW